MFGQSRLEAQDSKSGTSGPKIFELQTGVELFGVTAGAALIVALDGHHVDIDVACGLENAVDAHLACAIIDISQHHGNAGCLGDAQETCVPMIVAAACALRCHCHPQPVAAVEFSHHTVGYMGAVRTIDRYAAQSTHHITHGEEKPSGFHQETSLHPHRTSGKLAQHKIPIAGVRCHTDHTLCSGWNVASKFPPTAVKYPFSQVHR